METAKAKRQATRSVPRERVSRGASFGLLGVWTACSGIAIAVGCSVPGDFKYEPWELALGGLVMISLPVVLIALAMRTRTGIVSSALVATAALHLGFVDARWNLAWGAGEVATFFMLAVASALVMLRHGRVCAAAERAPAMTANTAVPVLPV